MTGASGWTSRRLALGFRRLAILDLTPTGHQPMVSADGRYAVVFNGAITTTATCGRARGSRHASGHLRHPRSSSRGTAPGGRRAFVARLWGMFPSRSGPPGAAPAAARDVWARSRSTTRAERPGPRGVGVKAIRAHHAFRAELDRDAHRVFLRFAYVPSPRSILPRCAQAAPGCLAVVRPGAPVEVRRYWDPSPSP